MDGLLTNLQRLLDWCRSLHKSNEAQIVEAAIKRIEDQQSTIWRLEAQIEWMEMDGKRMQDALMWYEDQATNCKKHGPDGNVARANLDKDGGQRARDALVID